MKPLRCVHLVHLCGERPEQQVGNDNRQANGDHGLPHVLALHMTQDQHLHHQTDDRRGQKACCDRQNPPASGLGDYEPDIAAEQIQRSMREVHVTHEAKYEGKAGRYDEIERGKRKAVQQRDEIEPRVVCNRPDREDRDRSADQEPQPLTSAPPHAALTQLRAWSTGGDLANTPSFMTARIRFGSRRIDRLARGSPSSSIRSAR